ncbi:hypothetical protein VZQ01_31415 [Myxococcus faecalis]|uniref:hypothetical protein n=1 Tax=Myxococcus faecalis TaxID=3115646 RepID=UPI003CF1C1FB
MQTRRESRRAFLQQTGLVGLALMVPSTVGCVRAPPGLGATDGLPQARPEDWDAVDFNQRRGAAGAIPTGYMRKINAPDGITQHLGKHLPYVPRFEQTPSGMLALMWGDPSRGYARHPNAAASPELPTGHWYDWIRLRRATEEQTQEVESRYSDWPLAQASDSGRYAALEGSDPAQDRGENTIYLVALPADARPGEWLRVHGHCLTHGEYVDFIRVPA